MVFAQYRVMSSKTLFGWKVVDSYIIVNTGGLTWTSFPAAQTREIWS